MYLCMYKNLFRAAAYRLGCHDGAMINCRGSTEHFSHLSRRTAHIGRIVAERIVADDLLN